MVAGAVIFCSDQREVPICAPESGRITGKLWAIGIGSQKYPFLVNQRGQSQASGRGHLDSRGCGARASDYEPGRPSSNPSLATSPPRTSLIRRPVDSLLFAPSFSLSLANKHGNIALGLLGHLKIGFKHCGSLLGQLGIGIKSGLPNLVAQSPYFEHPDREAWRHWVTCQRLQVRWVRACF